MSTSTPRNAATCTARNSTLSGRKYGVTIRARRVATLSAPSDDLQQVVEVGVRAVRHAARRHRAAAFRRRKPAFAAESFTGAEGPVDRECTLHVGDDRSVDPEMQASHRMGGAASKPMTRTNIDAAGEADAPVHHEDLTVVAQVRVLEEARYAGRQKRGDRHPGRAQHSDHRRPRVTRAYVVDEHPDLDATTSRAHQRVLECTASMIVVEDVGREGNRRPSRINAREHGRERRIAILQRLNAVAVQQGVACYALAQPVQAGESGIACVEHLALHRAEPGSACITVSDRFDPAVHRSCGAADAIDSKQEVRQRSDDRHEPGKPDPADDGRHVALAQHGIHGDPDSPDDVCHRYDDGPESRNARDDALLHG